MSNLAKPALKVLGYLFILLVLAFTGYQTWSLLFTVSQNPIVAGLGLVLFEGSMLYWWMFFQKEAEGLPQMALSLLMAICGLILVGGATALHLGAISAETFGQDAPAKLITVAALLNLFTEFSVRLLHPDTSKVIQKKIITGQIVDKTFKKLQTRADDMSEQLADQVAADWMQEIEMGILAMRNRPQLIEGEAYHVSKDNGRTPLTAFTPLHLSDDDDTAEPLPGGRVPEVESLWVSEEAAERAVSDALDLEARRAGLSRDELLNKIYEQHRQETGGEPHDLTYVDFARLVENHRREREFNQPEPLANFQKDQATPPRPTSNGRTVAAEAPTVAQTLDKLLAQARLTRIQARNLLHQYKQTTAKGAYNSLKMVGKLPKGMTLEEFRPLFDELMRDE